MRKYLSTCNISINSLWCLVKQPHYCVWLVRSLPPYYLGLVRFHTHNFKQPEEHMTPVDLDAALYVSTFIISSEMYFWWLHCPAFKPYETLVESHSSFANLFEMSLMILSWVTAFREWENEFFTSTFFMRAFLWIPASGPDLSLYWCVFALYRLTARCLRLHMGQQLRMVNCWVRRQWLNKSFLV